MTKLAIFDCDGTLVDSQHLIVAAMSSAFEMVGRTPLAREQVLAIVGLSLPIAIERLVPDAPRAEVMAISDGYKEAFAVLRQNPEIGEPLYDGIGPLLHWLHAHDDVLLAIATGKSRRGVDRLLTHHGLEGRFIAISTADEHPSKPHPSMIEWALSVSGAEARNTAMIGDTTFDIEMARAAGVIPVGVGWGYHPSRALEQAGAITVAGNARDLMRTLATALALTEPE